jgi:hypothetical protein
MNNGDNYLKLANSPLMWLACAIAVGVVSFQSILFLKKSIKASKEVGISKEQVSQAIKSSAISSVGPSLVILVTMISLLISMGAPVAWMRLSLVGSVNYEAMAAGFGAQAMGTTLDKLNPVAFSAGVWVMICGSLGWLIFTFLFTDKMEKVNHIVSKGSTKFLPILSAAAMLGAFANLMSGSFFTEDNALSLKSGAAVGTIAGCIVMMILSSIANKPKFKRLKEWAFAISMFVGMFIGFLAR